MLNSSEKKESVWRGFKRIDFVFNGHNAVIVFPLKTDKKNNWIWKTEFFEAFDNAEMELLKNGYVRVYYEISNMYGNSYSVRLMHLFYLYIINEYNLNDKVCLFGFSRGGLYAFNFALQYPEYCKKLYLDAPVLDLNTWPEKFSKEYYEYLNCYSLSEETTKIFNQSPINNLNEFSNLNIPVILIAGDADETVAFEKNSKLMIEMFKEKSNFTYIIKNNCGHHPHGLENIKKIIEFIND